MISIGQGTATAVSARLGQLTIPPGPCSVALTNAGTGSPVYIGLGGTGVTTGNGFPLYLGSVVSPTVIPFYAGNLGGTVYAITSGTAVVSWILSTSTGQTGL